MLPCASVEASVEPVSRGGEADPAWAALTGPPRMPNGTVATSRMAQRGVERNWSHHTGLKAAKSDKRNLEGKPAEKELSACN